MDLFLIILHFVLFIADVAMILHAYWDDVKYELTLKYAVFFFVLFVSALTPILGEIMFVIVGLIWLSEHGDDYVLWRRKPEVKE